MDLSHFSSLMERAFLEFRIRQTRQFLSVSLNSFANYLEFSPPIVKMWLNGKRLPTQGNVERLVPKLVELIDLEVYDILGLPRPDPDLQRLSRIWPSIPMEFRKQLADQGEAYAAGEKLISDENHEANEKDEDIEEHEDAQAMSSKIKVTFSTEKPDSSESHAIPKSP